MFVFQNRFWLNLHQFLSGEAYRRSVKAAPGLDPATLNASDRAIDSYNEIFKRDMIFDEGLGRMANAVAMTEDAARLPESLDAALGANIAAALNTARRYTARVFGPRVSATTMLGSHPRSLSCSATKPR
jgi:hypothetical protein